MRYLRLQVTRHEYQFLRWIEFENRRPWLDREDPETVFMVQFVGRGCSDLSLKSTDRQGNDIPLEIQSIASVPEGRNAFLNTPEKNRKLVKLKLSFPEQGGVYLKDAETGETIISIEPVVIFPHFLFQIYQEFQNDSRIGHLKHFIETGTLFGHTTLHASYWFEHVTTIELSEELHALAEATLKSRTNVRCLHGNSAELLPDTVKTLDGPSLFFLDAHWSGDNSVDWDQSDWGGYPVETAKIDDDALTQTDRQVPLMGELRVIADDHQYGAVIVIDDWNSMGQSGFAFEQEDWSALDKSKIINWISSHPRTIIHYEKDPKHYVWVLQAKQDFN